MDRTTNPFAPGAGTRPPELAGRERIIQDAAVTLERIKLGRPSNSQMLLGLRGVGKTVLLNEIARVAEQAGHLTIQLEAPEDRHLPDMLVPPLRSILYKLSAADRAAMLARKAFRALQSFSSAFKISLGTIDVSVADPGVADSGNLENDLAELLILVGDAARAADRPIAILIDEVQYLSREDLSALIVAIHKIGQRQLPIVLFGAGLPQLAGLAGEAKSYAERLFDYPPVGPLDSASAARAIREPIVAEGADIEARALRDIVEQTQGYPYFLQAWGSQAWDTASQSPITREDVARAANGALRALDQGFFRVRFDRLTSRERDYLRAMAELGDGPHKSGEIAGLLGVDVTTVAPLRSGLIRKGMIYSPRHGATAFTVPMFDAFMKRSMPDWKPASRGIRKP